MKYSGYTAYVPFFNNALTVRAAVESLLGQTLPPAEVLAIDDGSTDGGAAQLAGLAVRILRHDRNLGRGAARARAMAEARHELVLCCDATNRLPSEFALRACARLTDRGVAAAFGPIVDPAPRGVAARWRARHLFKQTHPYSLSRQACLATYGAMVKKSAVSAAGGFDPALSATEDADLGRRLLARGFEVVFAPELATESHASNTLGQVLERYHRWNTATSAPSLGFGYLRLVWYSWRVMVRADLAARDLPAALISFACPHYCSVRSLRR